MKVPGLPAISVIEAEARRQAAGSAALIVDVREPAEFENVRIEGAVLVPLSQFAARFGELPKDRPLLVMCASGTRSLAATGHLLRSGYSDVTNVEGGIVAWQRSGLPVKRGAPEAGEGDLPRP